MTHRSLSVYMESKRCAWRLPIGLSRSAVRGCDRGDLSITLLG